MRSRLSKRVGILVVVIASLIVGTSVLAQSPFAPAQNPIDAVLAKLDQVIETLTAPPPPPESGPVVLSTPAVLVRVTDHPSCNVVNVGTEPLSVTIRVGLVLSSPIGSGVFVVPPGEFRTLNSAPLVNPTNLRCEFSFEGTAAAVRANLNVIGRFTFESIVSVDAR